MIKKILVPTDGSDHANKAVDLAADLASKYDAELVILHVLLHNTSVYDLKALGENLNAPAEVIDELERVAKAMVDASGTGYGGPIFLPASPETLREIGNLVCDSAKQRAASRSVSKVAAHIADGGAADAILEAAEKENVDMIVMGSRGLGKIADLLMGSVSHRVSHMSKCTCITVK
jgi:nucleotide-binding universal stress UspA family protein